jgi:putative ABC transport system substrate-binding protein
VKRREFITLLGGAAAAWPVAARAQQPQKQYRIAFVHSGIPAGQLTENAGPFWVRRFYEVLRRLGDVEGGNLVVERYSAEGRSDRFAALAAAVVSRRPDVIIVNLNDLVKAFLAATSTIPIVAITADPIAAGLVRSLARPGGNLTGASINAGNEIHGKRLQILKEAMPSATKVAYLLSLQLGTPLSRISGITLIEIFFAEVEESQLRKALAEMTEQKFDAAIVDEGGSFLARRALIVELAEKHHLPIIYPYRDYVEAGGLMAYAPDLGELAQRLADDVHQILNGIKPGDIPYYQPTKFQLVINLKTAKALGIDMPTSILLRADEVIE